MKIVDLSVAKAKAKKRKAARAKLKKAPKDKTIAAIMKRLEAIEEYLGIV